MSLQEQINLPKGINSREKNTGEVKLHRQHYSSRLHLYTIPPIDEITIEEFESFSLDRLTVLKEFEATILRNKSDKESKEYMNQVLAQYLPLHTNLSSEAYPIQQERRKDHISHFILRLAYCRTEELRQWFLKYECALFKFRFINLSASEQLEFLKENNLNWKCASIFLDDKEKSEMKEQLTTSSPHVNFASETFFEVDFEKVLDLVKRRVVYIKGGKAYVPMRDQVALVMDEFRNRLDKTLKDTCRALPEVDQEGQVMPILNQLNHFKSGQGYSCSNKIEGQITADDIDQLTEHFPLCMRHLHKKLREDKHLKHYGRMQYNLFLKGVGLSLEEALRFWRMSFSETNDDQFQKKAYAYNIRHNYGMEGKRTNYSPLNCMRIITNNQPGEGDHHGCPFRHFSEANLSHTLHNAGVTDKVQIRQIIDYVKGHHYNIACTRFFELTHGGSKEQGMMAAINHPNEFFEKSYQSSQESSLGNK
ncbi:3692_t:CDS:10 [Ambispora gerdemannii]|uniref:DNA primase large subunit n=1 Tax=Ambispora gerdemannii TaxID=144530 RepID=A0A9N8YNH7_9GLOM|nr:3692_t:CDS:10 [Ambispora gerdemannii]